MAFEWKVNIETPCDCKGVRLRDLSGTYNGTTNQTGWDPGADTSGNPTIAHITSATANFAFSDGTVLNGVDIKSALTQTGIFIDFPFSSPIPDKLASMTVHFVGTANGGAFDYTATYYFYPVCQIRCCVTKMGNKVKLGMTVCKDEELKQWVQAKAWYDLILLAREECCDIPRADELYAALKKLCTENNFKDC